MRVKVKDNVIKRRVRGTYGGNLSDYQGETAAFTADLTTVKLLLNATVSEEGARFMTLDITDFYLCSPLERPEYMRIHRRDLPHETLLKYKDSLIFDGDFAMVEVTKSIYGLKQAGIIAQRRLIDLLARHNYNQAPNTRGLFTHATRPIAFSLVVDDFGVKYRDKADVEDLLRVLRLAYAVKEDWTGDAYIGLTIKHNFTARTISISMPGYVKAALSRFTTSAATASHTPTHCPLPFTPVTYNRAPQLAAVDTSPPLSTEAKRHLQSIVGTFLFYARGVDYTMVTAVNKLSLLQKAPTQKSRHCSQPLSHICSDISRRVHYLSQK